MQPLNNSLESLPIKFPIFLIQLPCWLIRRDLWVHEMNDNRLVYSTQIGRIKTPNEVKPVTKHDGIVRIRRETKGRSGKGVTTVTGVDLPEDELKALATKLKKMCATGGAIKDGIIEIQGDNRDKIKVALEKLGHNVKLAGG